MTKADDAAVALPIVPRVEALTKLEYFALCFLPPEVTSCMSIESPATDKQIECYMDQAIKVALKFIERIEKLK